MKAIKIQISLLITLLILTAMSCKKELTSSTDITTSTWSLKSVSTDGDKFKIKDEDYHNVEAYELTFQNDSVFALNTSVNISGGNYNIAEKGKITITSYGEITEVAGSHEEQKINENLITVFNAVTSYEVKGKVLIFNGTEGELKFRKK
jgi:heat shock protein HslJ